MSKNAQPTPAAPTGFLGLWLRVVKYLSQDLIGGPRIPIAWIINAQKGGTLPVMLGLMYLHDNWSTTAWIYTALHGSYGLAWLLKEAVFPDPKWAVPVTIPSALFSFAGVLGPYWLAGYLVITSRLEQPPAILGVSTIIYVVGVLLMMGSDAQKYFVLRERKGLITDGFFSRVRHPNYLGEMLLYGSFAIVAGHKEPWAVLGWVWLGLFVPFMLQKEASMSRYPGWKAYCAKAGFLLPRFF